MRNIFFLFLLFAHGCYFATAFTCKDILNQNQCKRLKGCEWIGTNCIGDYVPECLPPICQYVDSSTTAMVSDGTPQAPWRTLPEGLNNSFINGGSVIIINHLKNATVNMPQAVTLTKDVSIRYPIK